MIWIIFPAIVSGIAFFFRGWKRVITITLTLITLLLALSAWWMPIGDLSSIGPWTFTITDRLVIAGRQFILANSDRSVLIVVYLTLTFFFCGSLSARVSKFFVPLGLAMSALLVASLSVQPFLYAALLIEVAVLIGVPFLSPPGKKVEPGVLRYLLFMSFGFPFMLIGGGVLSRGVIDLSNMDDLLPALVILGLGFAFLLAIFPLNTWIPVLMERTHPYTSVFVLTLIPIIVIVMLLRFIRQYPLLLDFDIIIFLGTMMIFTGGLWAAFQRDLGRLLGYAVIIEIGYSLLAVSQVDNISLYSAMLLPGVLALGVWGLALSLITGRTGDLRFRSVQGLGLRNPIIVVGVMVAHFSVAGFPLLASFPFLMALWNRIIHISTIVVFLSLLGSVGLLVSALRSLAVFVMGPEEMQKSEFKIERSSQLLLLLGIFMIIIIGLFPYLVSDLVSEIVGLN